MPVEPHRLTALPLAAVPTDVTVPLRSPDCYATTAQVFTFTGPCAP
jgi:hypothetical protein